MLKALRRVIGIDSGRRTRKRKHLREEIPEITELEERLIREVDEYTMTSSIRRHALIRALHYVNRKGLEGDIVECGVWRGGNIFLARRLQETSYPGQPRQYFLFDTFEGMAEPSALDVSHTGAPAREQFAERKKDGYVDWCYASLEDVQQSARRLFGNTEGMLFIKGKVEDTLRDERNLPEKIAVLRLDTDWYESTKVELEVLYPRLRPGGVLIIDDYGYWQGARKAVDEYFADRPVLLHRIDHTCRVMVKEA